MTPFWTAAVTFACMLAGFLAGLASRRRVPEDHVTGDSKDTVKLGLGLIATLSALVLGLLVATTKGTYDAQSAAVKEMAASLSMLDRILARFGPEAKPMRDGLRKGTQTLVEQMWPAAGGPPAVISGVEVQTAGEALFDALADLPAKNDTQRMLKGRAMELMIGLGQTRQRLIAQQQTAIPAAFLVVLITWLSLLFGCYGLLSPRNGTAIFIQLVCMASVASALFLVLEMDRPFGGIIRISGAPLVEAVSRMGG